MVLARHPVFGFYGGSNGLRYSHCSFVKSPLLILSRRTIRADVCKKALARPPLHTYDTVPFDRFLGRATNSPPQVGQKWPILTAQLAQKVQ